MPPRRLTDPGCCARHWWSEDASQVLFLDDPPGDLPLGIYGVSPEGGEVRLLSTSVVGADLPPGDAPPVAGPRVDLAFRLPQDAQNISVSGDGAHVAWTTGTSLPVNLDRRQRSLWILDRLEARPRRLALIIGGDLIGWAGDGLALVVSGRVAAGDPSGLWRVPIEGTDATLLAPGDRPRGMVLSASRRWLAFFLSFDSDPTRNGVWVVGTGGEPARLLPEFGSYRWGGDDQLFFVPYGSENLSLMSFDPASGATEVVGDGNAFPGGIANNDWSVAPNGGWVVYRSAQDGALWIVPQVDP